MSTGAERQQLLDELADSGSKLAHDVLTAWTLEEIYLYVAPDGSKVPVLLEDQQDADGKARAIRINDGQFVKDADGKELRFGDSDLNTADTDMRLRSAIQQALDTLALSDPDPDARYSAANKLGNSQKEFYIPVLQRRLAREKIAAVKKAINEAIACLQLNDTNPAVQIAAVRQLAALEFHGQPGQPEPARRQHQQQSATRGVPSSAPSGQSTSTSAG